ncbi:CDGSH iron-sulfur domain-containing protein [Sulfurovum mangrovi]|uniref:CDGSH iron-sulfur domain-containing protein n=1 Tax=Sulfurovum mangrovi TaxID=2893889 RepID=UPI001E321F1E|nr:CDGSH iron-sulfur domain-containing protein [Sulfurovum mangrovi]UFH60088.1 CDGSH iron-sulfur domain-containing protein [Sulfurovum mangrovi]
MDKPVIADNSPVIASLEEGKNYLFCTCGLAKTQPFCDGSHKGSTLKPLKFTAKATTQKWMCMCKHTGNPPYCDGTHQKFSQEDVGKAVD